MNSVIASSTALNDVVESSVAKMAIHASDTALAAIKASGPAMAAMRAATQYTVNNTTLNGTGSVAISLPGTHYILLGVSRNSTTSSTLTMTTKRGGSTQAVSGATGSAPNTLATAVNLAGPLVAPFNASLSGSGTTGFYMGLLRCDV